MRKRQSPKIVAIISLLAISIIFSACGTQAVIDGIEESIQAEYDAGQQELDDSIEELDDREFEEPEDVDENFLADGSDEETGETPLQDDNQEVFSTSASYPLIYDRYDSIPRSFSEERAWTKYQNSEGEVCLAVIDTDGNAVFTLNLSDLKDDIDSENTDFESTNIAAVPFEDGLSYYYPCTMNLSYEGDQVQSGFVIIDKDGNTLYSSDDGDETTSYYILGYGNGQFIVVENVMTFSENKDYIYTMDQTGTLTSEKIEYGNAHCHYSYIGDGIFKNSQYIYNMNTHAHLHTRNKYGDQYSIKSSFVDGLTLGDTRVVISEANIQNQESWDAYMNGSPIEYGGGDHVGEGLVYRADFPSSGAYYDFHDGLAVSVHNFPETVKVGDCGTFSGGYAPIVLHGADDKTYVSVFDRSGELLYDPIPAEIVNEKFYEHTYSYHGYLLAKDENGNYIVITPEGDIMKVGVDDLSVLGGDAVLEHYSGTVIKGGFIIYTPENAKDKVDKDSVRYISLDGRKTIDSVKVTD